MDYHADHVRLTGMVLTLTLHHSKHNILAVESFHDWPLESFGGDVLHLSYRGAS